MIDRITFVACAIGAAALWFYGSPPVDDGAGRSFVVAALAIGIGAWGLSRATGSKGLLALAVIMPLAFLVPVLPSLIPRALAGDGDLVDTLETIVGALARTVFVIALAASLIAIRARVGGLAWLAIAPLVVGLLALGIAGVTSSETYSTRDVHAVAEATAIGLSRPARELAAIAWLLVGTGPLAISLHPSPGTRFALFAGAVGGLLIAASFAAVSSAHHFGAVATMFVMAFGWVLSAIGLGGLARAGGGSAAWVALALVVLELVVCPTSMFIGSHALDRELTFVLLPSLFGLAGFAIAMLGAREVPFEIVRRVVGGLMILAALGSCLASAALLATTDAIGLRLADPFWGIHALTLPAAHVGLLLWIALQALLGAPPASAPGLEAPAPTPV